jgi:hypothetical protein
VFTKIRTCETWCMIPPSCTGVEIFVIGWRMMTDPDDIDDLRCFNSLPSAIPQSFICALILLSRSGRLFGINASPILFHSRPHILHIHQRNSTPTTTASSFALPPRNSDQVYAYNPVSELALQFLFIISQHDLSRSKVRSGVAGSAKQRLETLEYLMSVSLR